MAIESKHRGLVGAIDWDGTAVDILWPERGATWKIGAVDALRELSEHGKVYIHTARIAPVMPDGVTARSLKEVNEEIWDIRCRLDEVGLGQVEIHTHPWKPSADFYVDDRAFRYDDQWNGWDALVPQLLKVWGAK